MNTKHAKSPCCRALIRKFGKRRRQCCACKRTWTIRSKKRGRPRIRMLSDVFRQIFLHGLTLQQLIRRRPNLALPAFRYRFRQAMQQFIARPRHLKIPPKCPLILLADGLWFNFKNKPWILYLTALKPCKSKTAVFLDPILLPDREGALKWEKVFDSIPPELRDRVCALVADNLQGMKSLAKHYCWILQLCQFHLILKLQVQRVRSRQWRTLRGGQIRENIYQLICRILKAPEGPKLEALLGELIQLSRSFCGTQRIQAVVRDFLNSVKYYRAYALHQKLNLPTTTNTMESMGSIIRKLLHHNHCASTPKSLIQWTTALIRMRPEIVCNGKNINRIN